MTQQIRSSGIRGKSRQGTNILSQNLQSGRKMSNFISTTLGPYGKDKLIYNLNEDNERFFEVSNDGSYLLKRIEFESPAAKLIAGVSSSLEDSVGDGTTTSAIYTGEILQQMENLLEYNIHPTTMISGVNKAVEAAAARVDEMSTSFEYGDRKTMENIARTSLSGRLSDSITDKLAVWIVDATMNVAQKVDDRLYVDPDMVMTENIRSKSIQDTKLIDGVVLKKSLAGTYTPNTIKNPTIALVTQPFSRDRLLKEKFENRSGVSNQNISYDLNSPEELHQFHNSELNLVADLINHLSNSGVDVVFVEDRVEDKLLPYFQREKIAVVRDARINRMRKIGKATGAIVNTHLQGLEIEDCGKAGTMECQEVNGKDMIYLKGCEVLDAVSLSIRGSTWMGGWEVERNITNGVQAVGAALSEKQVIPGGGAVEIELASHLRDIALKNEGKESIVIKAVGSALERIPIILAQNAGLKPHDILATLRSTHSTGEINNGILHNRRIDDAMSNGVIEASHTKKKALRTSAGVATTILKIDDVIEGINPENMYKNN